MAGLGSYTVILNQASREIEQYFPQGMSSLELPRHISFLLQRKGAKRVVLDTLTNWCHHHRIDLTCIGSSFDRINREYRLYIDQQLAPSLAMPASTFGHRAGGNIAAAGTSDFTSSSSSSSSTAATSSQQPSKVILDQSDIYSHILSPLLEKASKNRVCTEYVISKKRPSDHGT